MAKKLEILKQENIEAIVKKLAQPDVPVYSVFRENERFQEEVNFLFRNSTTAEIKKVFQKFNIRPLNPALGDKFASYVMGAEGKAVALITLGIFLFGFLPAIAAMVEGGFSDQVLSQNPSITFFAMEDIGYWNQFILSMPIVALVTSMYFSQLPKTLLELVLRGVFPITLEQWNNFVTETASHVYRNAFIRFTPYLIGLICTITLTDKYFYARTGYWNSVEFSKNSTIAGLLLIPNVFLLYFLIALAVLRVIATSFILIKFFKFTPDVQPLHPDSSGGLSPLGKLSSTLNLGTLLYGIFSVIGIYANSQNYNYPINAPVNVLIMVVYMLGALVIFFFPLLAAHHCMRESKYNTIQIINDRFEAENKNLIQSIRENKIPKKEQIEKIETLQKIHNIAAKMPVYPFNTETITYFLGSILIPVSLYILTSVIEKLFLSTP